MRLRLVFAFVLIAGCSSLYDYPTEQAYVVRAGDTLYSIAFRHGLDPRSLAAWNRISNPDRIYVGQRLSLRPSGNTAVTRAPSSVAPPAASVPPRSAPPGSAPRTPLPSWRWPVSGPVAGRFGDGRVLSTGIGISGALGQDIDATAAGRVMYAGSGLPDYGQLIIIEHDQTWLSAYGHNRRLLVSQGDIVTAGEKIAEMGTGPGGVPMLHFEIRRNGDPLDPLTLLPTQR